MDKQNQYAIKIMCQIQAMFDKDCENYIDLNELAEGDNASYFTHALATIAPAVIIGKLTNQEFDSLGFNHMANRLAAQFSNFVKE